MIAAAVAYEPSANSSTAVKSNSIARSVAGEALITEAKPLIPQARGMKGTGPSAGSLTRLWFRSRTQSSISTESA